MSKARRRPNGVVRAGLNPLSTIKAARMAGVRLPAAWLAAVWAIAQRY